MRTGILLAALSLVALAGLVSAHGFGSAAADVCSDDQTVGECREAVQEARAEQRAERCAERYDAAFCSDLQGLIQEHRAEAAALREEYGVEVREGPPRFQPSGDVPDDRKQALSERCREVHGAEYCEAWEGLKAEHKQEVEDLFAEAGYEPPEPRPKPFGHGPRGPRA